MTNNNNNDQNRSNYNPDFYSQNGANNASGYRSPQYGSNGGQHNNYDEYSQSAFNQNSRFNSRYDDLYDYEEETSNSFLLGAIVGGLIGAAAAIFLTPKSGSEMRENLTTQATKIKEKTSSGSSESGQGGSGFTQQLKDQSSKVVDKVKNLKGSDKSPMDDGTASSEGEEQIGIHETIQNSSNNNNNGRQSFTATANALKEAVEEVKEEQNSSSSTGSASGNTSSTSSNSSNSSNKNSSSSNSSNSGNKGSNSSNNSKNNNSTK